MKRPPPPHGPRRVRLALLASVAAGAALALAVELSYLAISDSPASTSAAVPVVAVVVGMGGTPGEGALPFDLDTGRLRPGQVVADLVYHPLRTPLLVGAEAAGAAPVDGLGMLVHQAALAFELWTGIAAPLSVMAAAARISLV